MKLGSISGSRLKMKRVKLEPIENETIGLLSAGNTDAEDDQKPQINTRWKHIPRISHKSIDEIQAEVSAIANDDFVLAAEAMLKAACNRQYLAESKVFSPDIDLFDLAIHSKKLIALRKLYDMNEQVMAFLVSNPDNFSENIAQICDIFPCVRVNKTDDASVKCQLCMDMTPSPSPIPDSNKTFIFNGCNYNETSLMAVECAISMNIYYFCLSCAERVRLYHSLRHAFYAVLQLNIRRIAVRYSETDGSTSKRLIAQQILCDYRRTEGEYAEVFWQDLRCDWFDALRL